ncbi:class C sortase [Schaalia sp. ZJ405]|uniref:class C sortase n=1 Tax=Schaalia sp. ZJ405 TaxID=2709403 RepID=UPI0013EC66E6|nr:class C sortase [Schaalia sp. ZJ405]QPK80747.1 class C sortase [Schaalia sp. ZJ405]
MSRLVRAFVVALLVLGGTGLILYPTIASWKSQWNQSQVVDAYAHLVDHVEPDRIDQIREARKYNDLLASGAVLGSNEHVPQGSGVVDTDANPDVLPYDQQLKAGDTGLMGRIRIPSIDVDLPIYHGTSEQTLLIGAGHLEGTSLPVGGDSTRTVITAHRGLPESTLFNNLDKVKKGDTFTLEVFGEVLTYRVFSMKVVQPEDSEEVLVERGRDLATLITCTPLGVNSHRILVTGERIIPTPQADLNKAGQNSELPRFPWWIPISIAVLVGIVVYLGRETVIYRRDKRTANVGERVEDAGVELEDNRAGE